MQQKIINFYQDELNDWVAYLMCGHSQHVRHKPPWQNRAWVVSKTSRAEKIGVLLDCLVCDEELETKKIKNE